MQRARFDEHGIVERFKARTQNSARLFRGANEVTPGGVMAGIKFFEPYPVFMKRAEGSKLWDVDGNEYVDYLMAYGALILGHGSPAVRGAVESVFESLGSSVTGTPIESEIEYGGMLRDIYHRDGFIRFTNSGLEATLLAVRLARGHTGRRMIAKFEGHYHGAVDHLLVSYAPTLDAAGSNESPTPVGDSVDVGGDILHESLVLPFNDWESTHDLIQRHSEELACVIMEPFEEGVIAGDPKFMKNLRSLTNDLGVPLVYDEVKTGFRVRLGGASEFYSITPDLTCLGKIIGGGLPIGAVVGDREIMNQLDPGADRKAKVFHSGTFNGNPLSLAAGLATVEELRRDGNFLSICRRSNTLKKSLGAALAERQIRHSVAGEGAMFNLYMTEKPVRNYRDAQGSNLKLRRLLDLELMSKGVYLKPASRFSLSLAHSDDDLRVTTERFEAALDDAIAGS